MKYLRAVISTETRGALYKKDFEAQNVFKSYARAFVSKLVTAGMIREGEFYSTLIVPHYGPFPAKPSLPPTDAPRGGEKGVWIALEFEDPIQPDTPIDYCTIEIFVVGRAFSYRANFHMYDIDDFWQGIERTLRQLGVLHAGERTQRKLYARDDEQADFEREELYTWKKDAASLIEIVSVENATSSFPGKSLADFNVLETKKTVRGKIVEDTGALVVDAPEETNGTETAPELGIYILITRPTLESVQRIACSGALVEQGGVLVGNVYKNTDSPGYLIEITDHILAERALANELELRYTFEAWQQQTTLLRERYPGKRIVGWYHTHLDLVKKRFYTDETRQSTYRTALFFSQDDLFMHRQFFREKWYVAMVLDTEGNLIFYQWIGNKIGESRRFYIIGPMGVE